MGRTNRANGRRNVVVAMALAIFVAASFSVSVAPPAEAFIPKAKRTLREIARVNKSSGRSKAIQLELSMRIGDRDPIARGQLISHPSGLARLELRGFNGRIDRYLLSGRELMGAKDGFRIERPQPMLQPLFFLQPSTSSTLRTALETFDVLSESIGLATCGDQDCFVIGDPRLAAPLPEVDEDFFALEVDDVLIDPLGEDGDEYALANESLVGPDGEPIETASSEALDGPELGIPEDAMLPRLWVDTEDLQVRRIDRASGVFTIFGPVVSFERLMIPAWFEIHEPGAEPIRFEVDRAVQVNAPPQAFSRKWLLAPVGDPAEESESAPGAPAPPRPDSP